MPFIHGVNKDIISGHYTPSFVDGTSDRPIPSHLKNAKADPKEILKLLPQNNRNEFLDYLNEREIYIDTREEEKMEDSVEETNSSEGLEHLDALLKELNPIEMDDQMSNGTPEDILVGEIEEINNGSSLNQVHSMMEKLRSHEKL